MNIFEVVVLTDNYLNFQEAIDRLNDQPLRSLEGMDFKRLPLDKDTEIYLYVFDHETESYLHLWDLIIPHAVGVMLVFDWMNELAGSRYMDTLSYLEKRFDTPVTVVQAGPADSLPEVLQGKRVITVQPDDKESLKQALAGLFEIEAGKAAK